MIKIFEEYKNVDIKKFHKKFFNFFNEIKKDGDYVEKRNGFQPSHLPATVLMAENSKSSIMVVNSNVDIFGDADFIYPLLIEYIESEILQFIIIKRVEGDKDVFGDFYFKFDKNLLTSDIVDKINLSKKSYEDFKESGRFGL